MSAVTLKQIVNDLGLDIFWGSELLARKVKKAQVSRPCIEVYGNYFDYFEADRIQVIGTKELAVFNMLTEEQKEERLAKLFSYDSPAYIFTKNVDAPKEFMEAAIKYNIPILKSPLSTSTLIGNLTFYLSSKLAPRKTVNGTLMDIHSVGVLIKGPDGIGKSETALELVRRGHFLVSDDNTVIYQREPGMVLGEAPKLTDKLMDIKNVGVLNVVNLYGIQSYHSNKRVQLIINLTLEDSQETVKNEKLFDTEIATINIYASANRNIATLIEAAALNTRLKRMGKDSDKELANRMINMVNVE